jgi:hypothetical protein
MVGLKVMGMSGFAVVVAVVVMVVCVTGVVCGARWISRYADAELEKTKRALKARHAVPDAVGPAGPAVPAGGTGRAPDHRCGPVDDTVGAGRHHVPEELLRASTYRLSQDRVARARAPQPPVLAQRTETRRRVPGLASEDAAYRRVGAPAGLVRDAPEGNAARR